MITEEKLSSQEKLIQFFKLSGPTVVQKQQQTYLQLKDKVIKNLKKNEQTDNQIQQKQSQILLKDQDKKNENIQPSTLTIIKNQKSSNQQANNKIQSDQEESTSQEKNVIQNKSLKKDESQNKGKLKQNNENEKILKRKKDQTTNQRDNHMQQQQLTRLKNLDQKKNDTSLSKKNQDSQQEAETSFQPQIQDNQQSQSTKSSLFVNSKIIDFEKEKEKKIHEAIKKKRELEKQLTLLEREITGLKHIQQGNNLEIIKEDEQQMSRVSKRDKSLEQEKLKASKQHTPNSNSIHSKENQIKQIIKISNNAEAKQQAQELIKKMKKIRREKDTRIESEKERIVKNLQSQIEDIKKNNQDHESKQALEKRMKVVNRIREQQQKKKLNQYKQIVSQEFIKEIVQKGADSGKNSKNLVEKLNLLKENENSVRSVDNSDKFEQDEYKLASSQLEDKKLQLAQKRDLEGYSDQKEHPRSVDVRFVNNNNGNKKMNNHEIDYTSNKKIKESETTEHSENALNNNINQNNQYGNEYNEEQQNESQIEYYNAVSSLKKKKKNSQDTAVQKQGNKKKLASIFTEKILSQDKLRKLEEEKGKIQKKYLYQKRSDYAKFVQEKFQPKIDLKYVKNSNIFRAENSQIYLQYPHLALSPLKNQLNQVNLNQNLLDQDDQERLSSQFSQKNRPKISQQQKEINESVNEHIYVLKRQQELNQQIDVYFHEANRAWRVHKQLFESKPNPKLDQIYK